MTQLNFRQGMVRTHPNAFQFTNGNTTIGVEGLPLPVEYTFADGPDTDYLYLETNNTESAWTDLPTTNPYYLYFELDQLTGERTFGHTIYETIVSDQNLNNQASNYPEGQMWFDTRSSYENMNVKRNGRFRRVIRVGAATVNGTLITPEPIGSQVGFDNLNPQISVGTLLFDDENKTKPVKRFDIRGRGKFITTTTPIFNQFSNLTGFRPEQSITDGRAVEPLGQYQCVALKYVTQPGAGSPVISTDGQGRGIGAALNTEPEFPCVGITLESTVTGEVKNYISGGYLTDDNFNTLAPEIDFSKGPGAYIFVSDDGQLTTDVPQTGSIQRIAEIVDNSTIYINVQPIIIYG